MPLLGNRARIHLWTDPGMLLDVRVRRFGSCVDIELEGRPTAFLIVHKFMPLVLYSHYRSEQDLQNLSSFACNVSFHPTSAAVVSFAWTGTTSACQCTEHDRRVRDTCTPCAVCALLVL